MAGDSTSSRWILPRSFALAFLKPLSGRELLSARSPLGLPSSLLTSKVAGASWQWEPQHDRWKDQEGTGGPASMSISRGVCMMGRCRAFAAVKARDAVGEGERGRRFRDAMSWGCVEQLVDSWMQHVKFRVQMMTTHIKRQLLRALTGPMYLHDLPPRPPGEEAQGGAQLLGHETGVSRPRISDQMMKAAHNNKAGNTIARPVYFIPTLPLTSSSAYANPIHSRQ